MSLEKEIRCIGCVGNIKCDKHDQSGKINIKDIIINSFRQITINEEGTKPLIFIGLEAEDRKVVNELLWKCEFNLQKAKGNGILFDEGKAIVFVLMMEGKPWISISKITSWKKVGHKYIEAYSSSSSYCETSDGETCINTLRFFVDGAGKPKVEYGYVEEKDPKHSFIPWTTNKGKTKIYDYSPLIDELPIEILPNFTDYKSDLEHFQTIPLINSIEKSFNFLDKDLELVKNNIMIFRSLGDNDKFKREVKKRNIHTVDSLDGLNASEILPIPKDPTSTVVMQNYINFALDKTEKWMLYSRDTNITGTNKFNMEIATFNQLAQNMLLFKRKLKEEAWTRFFRKFLTITNNLGLTKVKDVNNIYINVPISEVEQAKLDTLKNASKEKDKKPATNNNQNRQGGR